MQINPQSPMRRAREAMRLHDLSQRQAGVFSTPFRVARRAGDLPFVTRMVGMGDVSQLVGRESITTSSQRLTGSGTALDDADALTIALAEALERYSAAMYHADQFVSATAIELGREALDLRTIPRCSPRELSDPKCPLRVPDPAASIRWVRGLSLMDGRPMYLPAIMAYLMREGLAIGERFWLPITTGCAVHETFEKALVSAILEVIERDAISIVWLQKLSLPRIVIDEVPLSLRSCLERLSHGASSVQYSFFDATLDLGVPTVYGIQTNNTEWHAQNLVSCASAAEPGEALAKVIRDMASIRIAFREHREAPVSREDCRDVFDGASLMARADHSKAFTFLLHGTNTIPLSKMSTLDSGEGNQLLPRLLKQLRAGGLAVYAVDQSTDEALRVGLRAVRVIIPGLQPLSFHYRARFLGTPRLYEVPSRLGYNVLAEEDLNVWPQPFA